MNLIITLCAVICMTHLTSSLPQIGKPADDSSPPKAPWCFRACELTDCPPPPSKNGCKQTFDTCGCCRICAEEEEILPPDGMPELEPEPELPPGIPELPPPSIPETTDTLDPSEPPTVHPSDRCEKACPRNLDEQCGSDAKVYGNKCLFDIARCKNRDLQLVPCGPKKDEAVKPSCLDESTNTRYNVGDSFTLACIMKCTCVADGKRKCERLCPPSRARQLDCPADEEIWRFYEPKGKTACHCPIDRCTKTSIIWEGNVCHRPFYQSNKFAAIDSWWFDYNVQECKFYLFGGGKDNGNRFGSLEECESKCKTNKETTEAPTTNKPLVTGPVVTAKAATKPATEQEQTTTDMPGQVTIGPPAPLRPEEMSGDGNQQAYVAGAPEDEGQQKKLQLSQDNANTQCRLNGIGCKKL